MKKLLVALAATLFATSTYAAGLVTTHTAYPTPDATADFGLFQSVENLNTAVQTNMLSSYIINNNTSATINVPASTGYVLFTGTQTASPITVNLPSAANAVDQQEVTIFTQAAAASGVTVSSSGATVIGNSAVTWTSAYAFAKFKYYASLLTWYIVGH